LNIKRTITYDIGNPVLAWDRHKNMAELKQLMESRWQDNIVKRYVQNVF
jgi:hypothetical protein